MTTRPTTVSSEAASVPADKIWLRPALRRYWFSFLLVLLGLLLMSEPQSVPGSTVLQSMLIRNRIDIGVSVGLLVQVFGFLMILMHGLKIVWNRYRWHYMIGPYGVESVRGILGRDERRAEYANISYVRMYQGPIERLFWVGTLLIGTSATSEPEVIFADIASPKRVKSMIQLRMRGGS